MVSENAQFHAVFKSVENVLKNAPKLEGKQVSQTWVKVKKVHISIMFFDTQIKFFSYNFLLLFLAIFLNFEFTCAWNGSKNRKTFFL